MNEIRIVVAFDIGRLSPNKRLGWRARARETRAGRNAARWGWYAAAQPVVDGPVVVSVVVRRNRQMDEANIVSALKPLYDGLLVEGVVRDDSPGYVTLGAVTQEHCVKGQESVEFIIRDREATP